MTNDTERVQTLIIGGGQAGLSVGYHLRRLGREFLILDENPQIGDQWKHAWDSMRLFTPARYDGLPGLPFPASRDAFPTRDEMAAYLRTYAAHFGLPIRSGVSVDGLRRQGDGFLVTAGHLRFEADQVVVATGPHHVPRTPSFANALDPGTVQLHSSEYRNPGQLRPGTVLVVGASHSGADIALETAAAGHRTLLCGPYHGQLPWRLETRRARLIMIVQWFVFRHVLTVRTPMGRRVRAEVRSHGGPLLRVKKADLAAAGVERVLGRVTGVADGQPRLADGRIVDAADVIWCTGFRRDYDWIDLPVTGSDGYPVTDRGVSPEPGLYFAGVPFQSSFASMLIGGAGADAAHVAEQIAARDDLGTRTGRATRPVPVQA